MPRRSPGDGSIEATPDGRWRAVLTWHDPATGRRRRLVRRARNKTEARDKLRALRREIDQSGTVGDGRATVSQAVERWLDVKDGEGLADATMATHRWRAGIIVDELGDVTLSGLTVHHCDRLLRAAVDGVAGRKPLSAGEVKRLRAAMAAVLRNGMREGLVSRNVADMSVLPSAKPAGRRRRALSAADRDRLVDANRGTSVGALIVLCSVAALRPAEARGLRWADVDLDAGEVSIVRQMNSSNRPTSPKTRRASRRVAVPPVVVSVLREWRRTQTVLRVAQGPVWSDLDVIVSTTVGTPWNKDNLGRAVHTACDRAGVDRVTPYDLRHTALTVLAGEGHSNWQLADYAGTSERMIDDVYRHRTDGVVRLGAGSGAVLHVPCELN